MTNQTTTGRIAKKSQDLTIKDAFLFAAVMSDPLQCQKLLELVLEMKILKVNVIAERSMAYHPEYHGIRLDVYAEEDGHHRRFNVEMQVKNDDDLPRQGRFYYSHLDMDSLNTGRRYKNLPDTYVIFICDFPLFGERPLYRYTYRSACLENGHILPDGRTTVFLSTKGTNDEEVPKPLVDFLKYIEHPENPPKQVLDDGFVASLNKQVRTIKRNHDWEAKFMQLEEMLKDEREIGQNRVTQLMALLLEQNRMDDLKRAVSDKNYQKKLFEEFGL